MELLKIIGVIADRRNYQNNPTFFTDQDLDKQVRLSRFKEYNYFCIPLSFNTNILHQLLDYKIIFVNLQHEITNLKGDFVLKNKFKLFFFKDLCYTKINLTNL